MGPVTSHQLTISPPFFAAFCDLDGPYTTQSMFPVVSEKQETRRL